VNEPESPKDWQEALNLAELYSLVDSAVKYGLVEYTGEINVERCHDILEQGRKRGVYPVKAQVDALIQEFVRGTSAHPPVKKGRTRARGARTSPSEQKS
jgi:hypothetical protein